MGHRLVQECKKKKKKDIKKKSSTAAHLDACVHSSVGEEQRLDAQQHVR